MPKETRQITLVPVGCVHYGCALHAAEEFDLFCRWAAAQKDTYFIGMGDYFDQLSASERIALANPNFHESTKQTLEAGWEILVNEFVAKTRFMWGRTIGLVEGNHFANISGGFTTTEIMCQKYNAHLKDTPGIRCQYLGASAAIHIQLKHGNKRRAFVNVFCHHGRGAARTTGGSINTVEQMAAIADANIYLMGHDHKKGSMPDCKLRFVPDSRNNTLLVKDRPILYVRTGSFLKTYVDGARSYGVKRNYRPLQLGVTKITIGLCRNRQGGWEATLEGTA